MTLVDTSAWIEFFRGGDAGLAIDQLLAEDEVAVCGPILTELRRGLSSPAERRKLLPLLAGCHLLPQPEALWLEAGDLGFALARKGVTVKTLDLLIAVYALAHDVTLLTLDQDFGSMRKAGIPVTLA